MCNFKNNPNTFKLNKNLVSSIGNNKLVYPKYLKGRKEKF